jgi:SAM-dependent methyltransferase
VPFSARWGADRGTPIDRYYIDSFLSHRRHLIRGRTLEVRDDRYVRRFGTAVTSVDVLDIDPRNAEATIVADLSEEGSLPAAAFDCIVVTQTLQYVFDLHAALRNLWASLAPGGTLFVSVPAVSKVEPSLVDVDSWRLLPAGLRHLLKATCPSATIDRRSYGNVLVCTAFLLGVAAEELRAGELDSHDVLFVLINCAAVTKPADHDVAAASG